MIIYKCTAVHENVKSTIFVLLSSLKEKKHSFIRNNINHKEVIRCDRQYHPIEDEKPIKIDDYREFLAEKYGANIDG